MPNLPSILGTESFTYAGTNRVISWADSKSYLAKEYPLVMRPCYESLTNPLYESSHIEAKTLISMANSSKLGSS